MSLNIGFSLLLPLNVASCAKTGSSRDNCVQSENLGRRCFFDLLIAVQRPQLIPLCSGIDIQLYFSVCICAFVQCSIQYKHEQCTQEFCWPEPLSTQVGANSFGPLHDLCPDLTCLGSIFNLNFEIFSFCFLKVRKSDVWPLSFMFGGPPLLQQSMVRDPRGTNLILSQCSAMMGSLFKLSIRKSKK